MRNTSLLTGATLLLWLGSTSVYGNEPPSAGTEPTGEQVYRHWCADCHDPGRGHPATLRMAADFGPDNSVLLQMKTLTPELVKVAVRNGFQMMPPFRSTEISGAQLDRLTEFLVKAK